MSTKKISIIGAGNLGHHFTKAFISKGFTDIEIYSRTHLSAKKLAGLYNLNYTSNLNEIRNNSDIYLFLLTDTGVKEMADTFPFTDKFMVHCSGSIPLDIFKRKTKNYAVFYPFQTIKKNIDLDFSNIPLCIEFANEKCKLELVSIAEKLNCKYYFIDSEKRKILHLAAVFACNFMNHCVHLGESILKDNDITVDILKPLLNQSFENIVNHSASEIQTGPAIRGDSHIIEKHLKILDSDNQKKELYKLLSKSIKTLNNYEK